MRVGHNFISWFECFATKATASTQCILLPLSLSVSALLSKFAVLPIDFRLSHSFLSSCRFFCIFFSFNLTERKVASLLFGVCVVVEIVGLLGNRTTSRKNCLGSKWQRRKRRRRNNNTAKKKEEIICANAMRQHRRRSTMERGARGARLNRAHMKFNVTYGSYSATLHFTASVCALPRWVSSALLEPKRSAPVRTLPNNISPFVSTSKAAKCCVPRRVLCARK